MTTYGEWIPGNLNIFYCCDPSVNQDERTQILAHHEKEAAEKYALIARKYYTDKNDGCIPVWVYDVQGNDTRWNCMLTHVFVAEPE
jgi:hypothetical protein